MWAELRELLNFELHHTQDTAKDARRLVFTLKNNEKVAKHNNNL